MSFACGILFAGRLNHAKPPGSGVPLGFWFAQQGTINMFVLLILAYVVIMRHLDRKYRVDQTATPAQPAAPAEKEAQARTSGPSSSSA